ncbi:MAG: CPBP family intramembrane glutamic endopeptidase [Ferrimicrobium sp.]
MSSETRVHGTQVPPLWFPVVALLLSFVLSIVFLDLGVVLVSFRGPTALSRLSPFLLTMNECGLWIVFIGAGYFAAWRWWHQAFRVVAGLTFRPLIDIPVGLVIGAVAQLLVVPLLYLPFTYNNPSVARQLSKPAQSIIGIGTGPGFIVVFFVLVVGAPIAEEMFFRGLALRTIQGHLGRLSVRWRDAIAVVGSGGLFALAHFEPLQFVGLWVVGCILGFLALKTGRLGSSMVAHAGFNLVAVLALAGVR